jgi:hypothetical protein
MSTTVSDALELTVLKVMLSSNGSPINLHKFSKKVQSIGPTFCSPERLVGPMLEMRRLL